tara:strand:- start:215 stop:556 length:342 start_codon:yes stop_codon:yes gene_type:complete
MTNFEITPELLKQAKQAVNSAKFSATAERKKEAVDMLMKLAVAVQNLEEIKADKPSKPKAKKAKASKKKKAIHDNGRLAKKTRARRTSNERLDDHATKQSLDKLFDNAMALRY